MPFHFMSILKYISHIKLVCFLFSTAFLTPDKLKAHIATHSDERNFLCQHCGKYLKTDNSYRRHLVNKTNPTIFSLIIGVIFK
jgi:hypothetical protein